jgi:DNA repair exonuclease SbcCD ATPase subunit
VIRSLSLKNFQAWADVTLDLSPITVIIGETNAGKSSILRGLACVLFNALEGQGMVRQGASVAEVSLETDDGHAITWARGNNVNRYTLDGQLYDKPGRVVPLSVQDALQIRELEFDGETVRLQWAPQMDAPFLLADSGVKATRMLGVAGNAAVVAQAARLAQQETKDQHDALRSATTQLESLRLQLEAYKDVDLAQPTADALRLAMQAEREVSARRQALHHLYERHLAAQPRREQATSHLQTAQVLTERLKGWAVLHQRRDTLLSGAALGGRREQTSRRLEFADRLRESWQQRQRLEELKALFAATNVVQSRVREQREQMSQAMTQLAFCREQHEQLVASMTCPACGRVKEAA